jgi:DNA-binding MarR family transcriptional regulator
MDLNHVRRVRSFNRTVSQRIGALNDNFLDRGRPLGEARLLYEVGAKGADVRDLRARLELDSGYLSRLLRSLERQGMVKVRRAADDARVRQVALTAKGRREVAELDRRSDAFATAMLAPLSSRQRDRLIAAMADVEQLMRASAVQVGLETADSRDARWCLDQYFRELAARFPNGFDPARALSVTVADIMPPAGALAIARLNGQPIGCGALKVKSHGMGEIKRIWVRADARGIGVGRRLLGLLETHARELGLTTLRLDTNRTLTEAQAMYRRCGYREIERFNDEPYADHWFEKSLLEDHGPLPGAPSPQRRA